MIIAGYEYTGKRPFENVYLTGLVRDKQNRKMSKSLGNSPDALALIDQFGADGVRVGLLLSAAAGNDLLFDEALCQQGKGFANKIWNATRLITGWEVAGIPQPDYAKTAVAWYQAKLQLTMEEIEDYFSKYRISDALMATYKLVWNDFCSWFLEMIKPTFGQPIDQKTFEEVIGLLESNLKLLHPFMPFLTEEIWQNIKARKPEEALVISSWPKQLLYDKKIIKDFDFASEVISGIRTIRKEKNISFKDTIQLFVINKENASNAFDKIISKLVNLEKLNYISDNVEGALSFRVKSNEYFVPIIGTINIQEEIKKLQVELQYTEGFLKSVQGKLSNERFVSSAPVQVIASERKKEADALAKISMLKESLSGLL